MKQLNQIKRKYYDYLVGAERDFKKQIDFLDKIFKKHKVKTILDCGCGTGTYSVFLTKRGYKITAFDYSKNMVSIAREKARKSKTKIKFKVADIKNFDFGKFDAVISLYAVLMFACRNKSDLKKTIKCMKNSLNPKGIAFFETCTSKIIALKSSGLEITKHTGNKLKAAKLSFFDFNKKQKSADLNYIYIIREKGKKIKITKAKSRHKYFDKKDVLPILKKLNLKTTQLYGSFNNKRGRYEKFRKTSKFISPLFRLK